MSEYGPPGESQKVHDVHRSPVKNAFQFYHESPECSKYSYEDWCSRHVVVNGDGSYLFTDTQGDTFLVDGQGITPTEVGS